MQKHCYIAAASSFSKPYEALKNMFYCRVHAKLHPYVFIASTHFCNGKTCFNSMVNDLKILDMAMCKADESIPENANINQAYTYIYNTVSHFIIIFSIRNTALRSVKPDLKNSLNKAESNSKKPVQNEFFDQIATFKIPKMASKCLCFYKTKSSAATSILDKNKASKQATSTAETTFPRAEIGIKNTYLYIEINASSSPITGTIKLGSGHICSIFLPLENHFPRVVEALKSFFEIEKKFSHKAYFILRFTVENPVFCKMSNLEIQKNVLDDLYFHKTKSTAMTPIFTKSRATENAKSTLKTTSLRVINSINDSNFYHETNVCHSSGNQTIDHMSGHIYDTFIPLENHFSGVNATLKSFFKNEKSPSLKSYFNPYFNFDNPVCDQTSTLEMPYFHLVNLYPHKTKPATTTPFLSKNKPSKKVKTTIITEYFKAKKHSKISNNYINESSSLTLQFTNYPIYYTYLYIDITQPRNQFLHKIETSNTLHSTSNSKFFKSNINPKSPLPNSNLGLTTDTKTPKKHLEILYPHKTESPTSTPSLTKNTTPKRHNHAPKKHQSNRRQVPLDDRTNHHRVQLDYLVFRPQKVRLINAQTKFEQIFFSQGNSVPCLLFANGRLSRSILSKLIGDCICREAFRTILTFQKD